MTMKTKEPILSLQNIKKHYEVKKSIFRRSNPTIKAVNNIDFDVYEGETIGIVGESGCGKSTLGKVIMHLEKPTEGIVVFKGSDLSNKQALRRHKKDIQMIFQDPSASLNPRQKVGNAIEEPLIIHTNLDKQQRENRVNELLHLVNLDPSFKHRYPHELSGGQRQRINIARAIALNPKLIILDEAVSALDVSVQSQVINLLREIQEKKKLTFLFISHDLGVVRQLCDRVLVMYLGYMVELANADNFFKKPLHPYSEALLSAVPRVELNHKKERIKISGELPSPSNLPKGCPFNNRCPIATDICKKKMPKWESRNMNHYALCHHK